MSNWAQRGKEALATVSAVPEGMKKISGGGALEPIQYYSFSVPTKEGSTTKVIAPGTTLSGVYKGKFVGKNFGNTTHKLLLDNGELAGIPGPTQLNNALAKVEEGTKVAIVYNGKVTIKTGPFAGKQSHAFEVYSA